MIARSALLDTPGSCPPTPQIQMLPPLWPYIPSCKCTSILDPIILHTDYLHMDVVFLTLTAVRRRSVRLSQTLVPSDTQLISVVPLVLLIYDTLVTFDREVAWFWSGRMTSARILFFVNRYLPLLSGALGLIGYLPFSDKVVSSEILCLVVSISDTLMPMLSQRCDDFLVTTHADQVDDEHCYW